MLLPVCFPDELLFSRIERFISTSGITKEQFLQQVCGSEKASLHPYFPPMVTNLLKLTSERPNELIFDQTLVPLFVTHIPQYTDKIISSMKLGDTNSAVRASQMNRLKVKQRLTLKYCPKCVIENIENYGVAYWHRSHQVLGIETCYKHQVLLEHKNIPKRTKVGVGLPPVSSTLKISNSISFEFSIYVSSFLNKIKNNKENKIPNYFKRLNELGYINSANKIKRRYLTSDFFNFTQSFKYISPKILPSSIIDFQYLHWLLNKSKSQHPFKHLLFSFWLSKQKIININITPYQSNNKNTLELQCIGLLKQGVCIAEIQKKTNKSQGYISRLALRYGLFKASPSKKVTKSIQEEIIKLTYKGFNRKIIAKKFNISNITLEFMILSVNGLAEWRRKCKYESKRRKNKIQVIRYQQKNPDSTRLKIRKACSGAYCWLLKHEREWLEQNTPKPTPHILNFKK